MKKTIAILLVLVIGMVGVFAADATLNLTTSIDKVNRIAITLGSSYAFPTLSTEEPVVSETVILDHAVTFSTSAVDVGYIHYKTNNPNGVTVSMDGTYLENTEATGETYRIPYQITVAASSKVDGDTAKNLIRLNTESDTTAPIVLFSDDDGTEMFTDSRKIQISGVSGNAESYPAGQYEAIVTFSLTAI